MSNYKNKEIIGIYNVAYNDKLATSIKQDLDSIENELRLEKGRQNPKNNKGFGTTHINAQHINPKDTGYITQEEYLNLGNSLREYLKEHQEPHIDKNGCRVYEWENDNKVRFRVIVGDIGKGASTAEARNDRLPLPAERIISFYSDRNLNTRMEFKNLKVAQYYKSIQHDQSNQERLGNSKPIHSSQFKLKKLTKIDTSKSQEKGRSR